MRAVALRLLLLAVLIPACSRRNPATPPPAREDDLNVNGVRYHLPLTGGDSERAAEFLRAIRGDGISWSGGGHTLEVANGKIKLDGKDHGAVKQGDTVRLTSDGQLFVNDERRDAAGK